MLKLLMTDGHSDFIAIEMEKLRDLSLDVFPGTKIKIIGPIEVRRGIYMLRNHNVQVVWANTDNSKMIAP